jgi:phosphatidylglycerophosphate synthase
MLKESAASKGLQGKIGSILAVIPLSPNQWTILALLAALCAAGVIAFTQNLILGLALFVLAGLLDAVDGAVARARNETTKFGAFLDGISDRFMEFFFLFAFLFYPLPTVYADAKIWIAALIFFGTCMPAFIRSYAAYNGVISPEKAKLMGGFFERSERVLLLAIGLGAGIFLSMDYFVYAILLAIFLSILTVFQRLFYVYSARE